MTYLYRYIGIVLLCLLAGIVAVCSLPFKGIAAAFSFIGNKLAALADWLVPGYDA